MIRSLFLYIGRKKNPLFTIDSNVSSTLLFWFMVDKMFSFIRGLRVLLSLKKPQLLFLGKGVRLQGVKQITFGKIVQIGDHVVLSGYGTDGMVIGDHVWIGAYSSIKVSFSFNIIGSHIYIGNNVGIGEFAHLGGAGGLIIGDDCIIGPYLSCHPENHNFSNPGKLIRHQGVQRKGIIIGSNCWIGAKVTVLDGVNIGDNCVIAAGSVVTRNIPANSVIGGVPARIIRKRIEANKIEKRNLVAW